MAAAQKIEISYRTIVFTVLFLIFLWFLYFLRDLILEVFAALLIMTILNPLVTKISKFKLPRGLSIIIVYLVVLGGLGFAIAGIAPTLIEQTTNFVSGLSGYFQQLGAANIFGDQIVQQAIAQLGQLPGQAAKVTISIFSNLLALITVLIFAFYLLLARDNLDEHLGYLVGKKRKRDIRIFLDLLEQRLGGWSRGELLLMLIVGLFNYIGLRILGVPFALPLAILAGLLEVVPYLGPILAAIPAVIVGFNVSLIIGIATAALAFLVQQMENYLFVPKIMEKSVGVNPLITLLALAIGAKVAGVVGIIISVPIVITLKVLMEEYVYS